MKSQGTWNKYKSVYSNDEYKIYEYREIGNVRPEKNDTILFLYFPLVYLGGGFRIELY